MILSASGSQLTLVLVGLMAPSAAADWPQFRGPTGQGTVETGSLPTEWSETKNIGWKVETPGFGLSSPVVRGLQIWITAADEEGRSLRAVCFDVRNGRLLHNIELFRPTELPAIHQKNSFASPTPVIDDDRLFVNFGPMGTACLTADGDIVWKNSELRYSCQYGAASSPVGYKNLLILNCDGNDQQFIAAIDKRSGQVAWKIHRNHVDGAYPPDVIEPEPRPNIQRMAYSTPLVVRVGAVDQLISTAANHVAAYEPLTGREIWWYGYDGFSVAARPVSDGRLVFPIGIEDHASTYVLYGIDPNRAGRILHDEVSWRLDRAMPAVPSPIVVGRELFVANDAGIVTCVDSTTGAMHWRKRLAGGISASPIATSSYVYFTSENGVTTVYATGSRWREIAKNELDGRFLASAAVAGNSLILRSDSHLYRISSSDVPIATTLHHEQP